MARMNVKIVIIPLATALFFALGFFSIPKRAFAADFFYLSWNADVSAPIGYPAKKLPSSGSIVNIYLQPFLNKQENFGAWTMKWYVDGKLLREGTGREYFYFPFEVRDYSATRQTVAVEVEFPNKTIKREEIVVPVSSPKVFIRPVQGEYEINNGAIDVLGKEIELEAGAYFFNNKDSSIYFRWLKDGNYQFSLGENSLIIKKPDYKNSVDIAVIAENSLDVLTRGESRLVLRFY